MKVILRSIELENFKTYAGKVTIGPLKSCMAIIGPNGSGKSNLLDAISFALGEKVSNLRVKELSGLIHGAHIDKPVSQKASVRLNFCYEDGTSIHFTRTVVKSVQHYYLNNECVSCAVYLSELETLGINIKAKNFLVYQGMIETIALMNPKERTALFEEISGSKTLKKKYDELKTEMNHVGDVAQMTYLKQRNYRNDCKEAKLEKHEGLKHRQLEEELDKKYIELQLFKLFYIEKDYDKFIKEKSEITEEIKITKDQMDNAEKLLSKEKERLTDYSSELLKLEMEIQTQGAVLKELQMPLIKIKQEAQYMDKKVETALSSLRQAQEVRNKHLKTVEDLKAELSAVEIECRAFEEKIAEQSLSQGMNIVLEESQVQDYNELKRTAANLSASFQRQIEILLRKQKADQDILDSKTQKYDEVKDKYNKKCSEKICGSERCGRLSEHIRSNEKDMGELRAKQQLLLSEGNCQEKIASIKKQIDDINIQLIDSQADEFELRHGKKKLKVVPTLKRLFPGVYDRLLNLCEPIHQKYTIAITKVLGKYMHAIVVDKEETARCCIGFLKKSMMDPETFLPLDFLKVEPLQDHLCLGTPKQTYFLYNVLNYNPPEIKRAVLFATRSALVCETTDIAEEVASHPTLRRNVVSLDGTYYQKSGLMSGGTADLARKAKHWDQKLVAQMEAQKEELLDNLRRLIKDSHGESELKVVECEVSGLKSRIGFMKTDLEKSLKNIGVIDGDVDRLKETLKTLELQINENKQKIEARGLKLKELEDKMCLIDDQVFAEFCIRIGVPNIRAYETASLRSYEDRVKQRQALENRKTCIQYQLDYEKTVDSESNVKQWTDTVQLRKNAVVSAKSTEKDYLKKIERVTKKIEKLVEACARMREYIHDLNENIDVMQENASALNGSMRNMDKQLAFLETEIEKRNRLGRQIGIHCFTEGIKLPLLKGNLESLILDRNGASSSENSSSASDDSQTLFSKVRFDYNDLADDLKELENAATIKEHEAKFKNKVENLAKKLHLMNAPDLKADQKVKETTGKLRETKIEFDTVRKQSKMVKDKFEKVMKDRCDRFNNCFDFVSNEIDVIYKEMTQSTSAMALLTAENQEEPYLGGTSYCCIAPGKACKPMHSLSGGEKTVASIALLVALHQYCSAPFLILDEIDAALDNTNIAKVANFFCNHKGNFQTVAISLRPEFYCHVDALIGVTRDVSNEEDHKSVAFLFDLEPYPK